MFYRLTVKMPCDSCTWLGKICAVKFSITEQGNIMLSKEEKEEEATASYPLKGPALQDAVKNFLMMVSKDEELIDAIKPIGKGKTLKRGMLLVSDSESNDSNEEAAVKKKKSSSQHPQPLSSSDSSPCNVCHESICECDCDKGFEINGVCPVDGNVQITFNIPTLFHKFYYVNRPNVLDFTHPLSNYGEVLEQIECLKHNAYPCLLPGKGICDREHPKEALCDETFLRWRYFQQRYKSFTGIPNIVKPCKTMIDKMFEYSWEKK